MRIDARELAAAAVAVLQKNDRGAYSVPCHGLYPMQFNWDSAFAALGYCRAPNGGGERAWQELETLCAAQRPDGMIPHIVFLGDYQGYFPGPSVWQAGDAELPTSGISNPPVAAFAVSVLARAAPMRDAARRRRLLRALVKWMEWFDAFALHEESGAFVAAHPWETGRDNLCDWDAALARIAPRDHGAYQRSDILRVDESERPRQADYDAYLEIVAAGRERGWEARRFRRESPFLMLDPGITAILAHACDCLQELLAAEEGEMEEERRQVERIGARARRGLGFLWNEEAGGYTAYDPVLRRHCDGLSAAAFLAPLAGLHDGERHARLMREFDRVADSCVYAVPSYDPASADFEPRRYWRGPVWLPMNVLIAEGLWRAGENARARRVAESSLALAAESGFCEYFEPRTGEGLGGREFTWSAAAALHFLHDARVAGHA